MRLKPVLLTVAALMPGILAFTAPPASASPVHGLRITGAVDIKDEDPGTDDWCHGIPITGTASLDHQGLKVNTVTDRNNKCDEVRIEIEVTGELKPDDRICNLVVNAKLYESTSGWNSNDNDLDGWTQWKGGMDYCLKVGGSWTWASFQVDNTAERGSDDHGWLKNFKIDHKV